MRKIKYIIIMSVFTIILTGCFNKKLTTTEFKAKMESLGYTVEIKNSSGESSSEVEEVAIASKENYEIKFYVLTNSGTAIDFSELVKKEWAGTTNYTDIKRNDNTLIIINVPLEKQKSIQEDIKTLGY